MDNWQDLSQSRPNASDSVRPKIRTLSYMKFALKYSAYSLRVYSRCLNSDINIFSCIVWSGSRDGNWSTSFNG